MNRSLDDVKAELRQLRLSLLRREAAHLDEARRILQGIETSGLSDARTVNLARRSVELAEEAQRLGIKDAHRVGATRADIALASGIDEPTVADLLASDS